MYTITFLADVQSMPGKIVAALPVGDAVGEPVKVGDLSAASSECAVPLSQTQRHPARH